MAIPIHQPSRILLALLCFLVSLANNANSQGTPATSNSEVQSNDLRISSMGPDSDAAFSGTDPVVAPAENGEFIIVWRGDDNTDSVVDGEFEIYAQRVSGLTGKLVGERKRISDMGADGDTTAGASSPAIVKRGNTDEYLIVWRGDDPPNTANNEDEIFGQFIDGNLNRIKSGNIRISRMGPNSDTSYFGRDPDLSYNSTNDEYFVVWQGRETGSPSGDNEIYGQRINADSGTLLGGSDAIRISSMGPEFDPNFSAATPAITYVPSSNSYLVVWRGDDQSGLLGDNEFGIFCARLSGDSGSVINTNRIMTFGGLAGDTKYGAYSPDIAYSPDAGSAVVIATADDNKGDLVDGELEVYAKTVSVACVASGDNRRISDMGTDGDTSRNAYQASIAYDMTSKEYLVVWEGTDDGLAAGEFEIFGQQLDQNGAEFGENDFRLSDMGPEGSASYDASSAAVAYSSTSDSFLAVWHGDDNIAPLVDGELEVFGQFFGRQADLSVTETESQDPINAGQTLTYTINVENLGPDSATEVVLQSSVPSGSLSNAQVSGDGWSCSLEQASDALKMRCSLGELAVAKAPAVTFSGTVAQSSGTLTNSTLITHKRFDPRTENDSARTATNVGGTEAAPNPTPSGTGTPTPAPTTTPDPNLDDPSNSPNPDVPQTLVDQIAAALEALKGFPKNKKANGRAEKHDGLLALIEALAANLNDENLSKQQSKQLKGAVGALRRVSKAKKKTFKKSKGKAQKLLKKVQKTL